jgi:hypothetical protein
MTRRLVTLTVAAVLLACWAVPSFADHHGGGHGGGGGGWNGGGGGWHHSGHGGGWGVGPAIGLGLGLGLLGGALATAPYYSGYDYDYAPYAETPAPTVWYWCDPYQGYYPAVPECPVPWRQVVQ